VPDIERCVRVLGSESGESGLSDEAWFGEVYARRYSAVFRYGARRLADETAREMTAEVFLVLWRKLPELGLDDELPWLYAVARRVTANVLRGQVRRLALARRVEAHLALGAETRWESMEKVDSEVDVRRHLAALPPVDQEALLLSVWEEVDAVTGAKIVGCSTGAFKARVFRARRRLAEALAADPAYRHPARSVIPINQTN
jgi:RNA polymerase sigma-70 factor (ECF subfamily)